MAEQVPDITIVYLVRDRVERAVASYVEQMSRDVARRPIEEAFADRDHPFNPNVAQSRYATQLERDLKVFGKGLAVLADRLRTELAPEVERLRDLSGQRFAHWFALNVGRE
ncbi:MAG: hypothetical protein M3O28_07950 [Actinomycetota bacterium]|nr:hypothetical protein [Actinomycetota bacterium]